MDEAKALYEWDYRKQLLAIQLHDAQRQGELFSEEFLLPGPLLAAIRATEPVVLLIPSVRRLTETAGEPGRAVEAAVAGEEHM